MSCSMSFKAATSIAVLPACICCHCMRGKLGAAHTVSNQLAYQPRAAPGTLSVSTGQLALPCPYKLNACFGRAFQILIRLGEEGGLRAQGGAASAL
jgi:hypothetical protein